MKVLVRKELCIDTPVNLRVLSPLMKVYAGIALSWHQSNWYQKREHQRQEKEHAEQMQRDNKLKDGILLCIYRELLNNATLKGKDVCNSMIISVDHKYKESLQRILGHKDFLAYDIEKVEEDANVRMAFPEMPILLKISRKTIQGD